MNAVTHSNLKFLTSIRCSILREVTLKEENKGKCQNN